MSRWVGVGREGDVQPGQARAVEPEPGLGIAIFNVDGELYAIEDLCTHEEEILSSGEFKGCEVTCCRHGARFNVKTGDALCAPAYEPVTTFPVRVREGQIEVAIE